MVPNFRKSNILILRPINIQALFQTSGNDHTWRAIVKMEKLERGTAVSKTTERSVKMTYKTLTETGLIKKVYCVPQRNIWCPCPGLRKGYPYPYTDCDAPGGSMSPSPTRCRPAADTPSQVAAGVSAGARSRPGDRRGPAGAGGALRPFLEAHSKSTPDRSAVPALGSRAGGGPGGRVFESPISGGGEECSQRSPGSSARPQGRG